MVVELAIDELKAMLEDKRKELNKLKEDAQRKVNEGIKWRHKRKEYAVYVNTRAKQIHQTMKELHAKITKLEIEQQTLEEKRIAELRGKVPYDEWVMLRALQKNSDASDKTLIKMVKAIDPRAGQCLVAPGKPDRAAKNLHETQDFYLFNGTNGWAEYEFPKPADADCMHVFIKATTEEPRPVQIFIDGKPAGTHMETFKTGSYWNREDLQWVSVGQLNCMPGATHFKLKIVPVGFAPHIAAVAVLPFSRPAYEIIPGLDFGGKFDVKTMKADNLHKVQDECARINCNVFVVSGGNAYLKRVMVGFGGHRPVQPPNKSKSCTMYVQKEFASAIRGAIPR